jgi:hypothetical protein
MAVLSSTRSTILARKKSTRQKRCRRKHSLMKKACEYSKMCDADVCLGIRIRETGQIAYLLSRRTYAKPTKFWPFYSFLTMVNRRRNTSQSSTDSDPRVKAGLTAYLTILVPDCARASSLYSLILTFKKNPHSLSVPRERIPKWPRINSKSRDMR